MTSMFLVIFSMLLNICDSVRSVVPPQLTVPTYVNGAALASTNLPSGTSGSFINTNVGVTYLAPAPSATLSQVKPSYFSLPTVDSQITTATSLYSTIFKNPYAPAR